MRVICVFSVGYLSALFVSPVCYARAMCVLCVCPVCVMCVCLVCVLFVCSVWC